MFQKLVSILLILVCVGCAPRGETKTLDQILDGATTRYQEALQRDIDPGMKETLAELASGLERVLDGKDVKKSSGFIAAELHALTDKSGYTSRPALGAIADQYRTIASSDEVSKERRVLLVSRTYTLLAQELETMQFRLTKSS